MKNQNKKNPKDSYKNGTQAKYESKNRYRMIFDNANDGIILHDFEGRILDVNRSMYRRLGFTKKEMLAMNLTQLVSPEFAKKIKFRTGNLAQEGVAIFESADRRKDGTYMPVEVSARVVLQDGKKIIQSVVRDIHERKMAEALIESVRKENRLLHEEIQNNLDIYGMIGKTTLECLPEKTGVEVREHFRRKALSRLQVMDYMQKKIYQNRNYSSIDFNRIIDVLITYLYSTGKIRLTDIRFEKAIKPVTLPVSKIIPAYLIAYELISNAFVHAFIKRPEGNVRITFTKENHSPRYRLVVHDNGEGLTEEFDFEKTKTLGFRLIRGWVDRLGGRLEYRISKGSKFTLRFD